jgi:hypothetical protein
MTFVSPLSAFEVDDMHADMDWRDKKLLDVRQFW